MDIEQKVLQVISDVLRLPQNSITNDIEIGDLPGWDSIHHLTILSKLENTFRVKFDQADLADCETISDLKDLIEELSA